MDEVICFISIFCAYKYTLGYLVKLFSISFTERILLYKY